MSGMAKFALMFVVFVDILGQGLVFPIINALLMEPNAGFIPASVPVSTRHLYYGVVIGTFFLAWFIGVVYVSKVSDSIGRKNALMICLGGALAGYVLTIVALALDSMLLLILGRAVTGFTAGNQPIAQAAMIDGSRDEAERDKNMGYIVTGVSFGLLGGPVLGAVLSDKSILGHDASDSLPFYGALILVAIAMALVMFYFQDVRKERTPFVFQPRDVVDGLLQVRKHPLVLELMPVYTCFMIANATFYIFIDNYLTSAYGYGVIGGSVAMLVVGVALATSSTFLVGPAQERFSKRSLLIASLIAMFVCGLAVTLINWGPLTYVPVFLFYALFGISYPTILGLFSSSVTEADQGWVMGVTTAVFCLAGGIMSLIGGGLMEIDIAMPYYIVVIAAALGLVLMALGWRGARIRGMVDRPSAEEA